MPCERGRGVTAQRLHDVVPRLVPPANPFSAPMRTEAHALAARTNQARKPSADPSTIATTMATSPMGAH
eukprot:7261552-Pyramimonas_sp.AAC.1